MNKKFDAKQLTLLGLMTALLLLMSFTPLGYLNIGPLAITFNVIPVAVSALALGPVGGLIAGSVFGLTSFLQAIGVGGVSMLGSTLFSINPFFSILLCFVPRMLDKTFCCSSARSSASMPCSRCSRPPSSPAPSAASS